MHGPRVAHEICAGPRMAREELERDQLAFEPIAGAAGDDKVSRIMGAASRARYDVVQGGCMLVEASGAIHAALPTITQGHLSHGAFVRRVRDAGARARQTMALTAAVGPTAIASPARGRTVGPLALGASGEVQPQSTRHQ